MTATAVPALRRILREKGYRSGRALARDMPVSHNAIHTWMAGKNRPLPHNLWRLEELLGESEATLFAPDSETAAQVSRNGR
jgi:transcriptional regulator with XRE-family HTH domain